MGFALVIIRVTTKYLRAGWYYGISLIRFLLPWVIRGSLQIVMLLTLTLVSIWVGIPKATHRLAESWVETAVDAGFPLQLDTLLYWIMRGVAFVAVVVGWVILSIITVAITICIFYSGASGINWSNSSRP